MTLHPHAAGLLPLLDPRWSAKIWRGGLVLCLPFVGWPAVLGYRACFVRHLFTPHREPLPDWRDGLWKFVLEGLCAIAVIFAYLAPVYAAVAWLAASRGFVPGSGTIALALAFAAFPIFSTLSLPVATLLLTRDGHVLPIECVAVLASWCVLVFLVPAGFLQVSQHGRHRHAFAIWRTVPFVVKNLRSYAAAWWHSGLMSLVGHLCLPLAPWGVVWCYLGIVAVFNELLVRTGLAPGRGWLEHALVDGRFRRRELGRYVLRDAAGEQRTVVELGFSAAPLPRFLGPRGNG